jgi:hypothetical protein
LDSIGGWLIIPQTVYVHAEIERLLRDLRKTLDGTDTPLVFGNSERQQFEERIFAALEQPIEGSYVCTKLSDVCKDVASQLDVPVLLSHKKLEEAGVSPDAPITCEFPPAPSAIQLARILQPLDLTIDVRGEALGITTPEDAEGSVFPRVYDARPLLEPGICLPGMNEGRYLVDLIESQVRQTSWDNVGGPGAVDLYRGLLVVSQTLERQNEVATFLNELRRATLLYRGRSVPPDAPDLAKQRILAALDRPITLDHENVPLREVARSLARQLEIPVRVAEKHLVDLHNVAAQATRCHFPLAAARVQLDRLCDLFKLDYEIRDGALILTDRQAADFTTHVYDARSLIREPDGLLINDLPSGRQAMRDILDWALADTVKRHTSQDEWSEYGGPGSADCLGGMLIVTQTRRMHERVEALLDMLHDAAVGRKETPDPPGEQMAASDLEIDRRLERETELHLNAETVGQAREQMEKQLQMPVFLHPLALTAEERFESPWVLDLPAAPVWRQLERVEELRMVGRPRVRDGYIVLLWSESVHSSVSTRCYDIAWLRAALPALFGPAQPLPELIHQPRTFDEYEALQAIVERNAAVGVITPARDTLIISTTHAGHREVRELLSKLKAYVAAHPTPPQNAAALLDELAVWLEMPR